MAAREILFQGIADLVEVMKPLRLWCCSGSSESLYGKSCGQEVKFETTRRGL